MGNRDGQADVAHSLATDDGAGYTDATLVADDVFITNSLVFTTVTFPVLGRSEDLLAEESVLLRLLGTVVNGLGLGDFTVRPLEDQLRRSH